MFKNKKVVGIDKLSGTARVEEVSEDGMRHTFYDAKISKDQNDKSKEAIEVDPNHW